MGAHNGQTEGTPAEGDFSAVGQHCGGKLLAATDLNTPQMDPIMDEWRWESQKHARPLKDMRASSGVQKGAHDVVCMRKFGFWFLLERLPRDGRKCAITLSLGRAHGSNARSAPLAKRVTDAR